MKKMLLSLFGLFFFSSLVFAQCDELFISEYVKGFGNNRAVEIYNPTPDPISLDDYSVGRFRDGASLVWFGEKIPPGHVIQPYSTFVIVQDKHEENVNFDPFEHQVWDGFISYEVVIDPVTGEASVDGDGNVIMQLVGETVAGQFYPTFGDVYTEEYDLKGKGADGFGIYIGDDYDTNRAFFFGGNDAVVLTKGSNPPEFYETDNDIGLEFDGLLLDVVGVIGENPEDFGQDAWTDENETWYTKSSTIVRRAEHKSGLILSEENGDDFNYQDWTRYQSNTFTNLGWHSCECDPNYVAGIENASANTKVYPNPLSGGNIVIESNELLSQIIVYNIMGQKVRTINVNGASNLLKLNLGKMTPGIYTMHLVYQNGENGIEKLSIR